MLEAHPRLAGPWLPTSIALIALLPFGTVSDFARNLLTAAVAAVFLIATLRLAVTVGPDRTPSRIFRSAPPLAVLALPIYVTLQAVTEATLGFSAGPAEEIYHSAAYLAVLAAYFLLAQSAITAPRDVHLVLVVLAMVGALEATYGVLNLMSGNETLLGRPRQYYPHSATGTLISRNHFAYLMEMLLPVCAAFAAVFAAGARQRADGHESEEKARGILISTLTILCGMGLLLSRSRTGLIAFAAAALTITVLNRWLTPRGPRAENAPFTGRRLNFGIGAFVLIAALMLGSDAVLERFVSLEQDLRSGRLPLWHATLEMWMDRPLFGHGWGTYEGLLPGYRLRPLGDYYDHAHSEYLEVLAEGGIVGFTIVTGLLFAFARRLILTLRTPLSPVQRTAISLIALAVLSVLYHSAADFGLRVPGVALTFLLVVALFCSVSRQPALLDAVDEAQPSKRLHGQRHRPR
jgi:O-antigen ligase